MKRSVKQILKDAAMLVEADIKEMKWAIIIIIAYFVLSKIIMGGTCPLVMITGFPCPACGLTRAGMLMLCLDFATAWRMNPFIYVIVIMFLCILWRRYILLKQEGKQLIRWGILLIVAMTIFYVWRMINYFPGEPPMSYYRGNLLRRIGIGLRL